MVWSNDQIHWMHLRTVFHSGVNVLSSISVDFFCPENTIRTMIAPKKKLGIAISADTYSHLWIWRQRKGRDNQIRPLSLGAS